MRVGGSSEFRWREKQRRSATARLIVPIQGKKRWGRSVPQGVAAGLWDVTPLGWRGCENRVSREAGTLVAEAHEAADSGLELMTGDAQERFERGIEAGFGGRGTSGAAGATVAEIGRERVGGHRGRR
jgi:hypothetical protein